MKKRIYLQPDTEITGVMPVELMKRSPGWAKDGNPPFHVEQEDDEDGDDFFLDLD